VGKILIYGGAFDPVTIAHEQVVHKSSELVMFDEVWIMPCYTHMFGKQMSSSEARLEMCYRLKDSVGGKVRVTDFEITSGKNLSTYDLLRSLRSHFPNAEFYLGIGSDNLRVFDTWKNYKALAKNFGLVVFERPGYESNGPDIEYKDLIKVETDSEINISSTMIRKFMVEGKIEEAKALMPEYIWPIVERENLYHG